MSPVEKYINKYNNLDQVNPNSKVIICLIVKNDINLTPTIKSLLDQTVKVNQISVIIPENINYTVPNILTNIITIYKCDKDKSLLNFLYYTLLKEGEENTKIITLNNNKIYGKDFIETLLETSEKKPMDIIHINNTINIENGCLFSTQLFNEDFIDINQNKDNLNQYINNYFKNTPKTKINYSENFNKLFIVRS